MNRSTRFGTILLVLGAFCQASWARAQECIDFVDHRQVVGSIEAMGSVTGADDIAYVFSGRRLELFGVSDPRSPVLLGSVDLSAATAVSAAIAGGFAYVAAGAPGIFVLDVRDPRAPALVATLDTPYGPNCVAIAGSHAYVGDQTSLQIVDISDPQSPRIVGQLQDRVYSVAASGNIVCYSRPAPNGYTGAVAVVDVSNPAAPRRVGEALLPSWTVSIQMSGHFLYAAYGGYQASDPGHSAQGVAVIDVSDPQWPVVVSSFYVNYPPHFIALFRNSMVVATVEGPSGDPSILSVWDVSDPMYPFQIDEFPAVDGYPVAAADGYVYLRDATRFDLIDARYPMPDSRSDTAGQALEVALSGNYAYVADGSRGVQVIDVTNPEDPRLVGQARTVLPAARIAVAGNRACVAGRYYPSTGDLTVLDLSQPETPAVRGRIDFDQEAVDVAVAGDLAAVVTGGEYYYPADCGSSLWLIDISDPHSPQRIGVWTQPFVDYRGVALQGTYAYTARGVRSNCYSDSGAALEVLDISDPRSPRLASRLPLPIEPRDLTLVGNFAYLIGDGVLIVVDISNPLAPALARQLDPIPGETFTAVAVTGGFAYVGSFDRKRQLDALRIFDVHNPRTPVALGKLALVSGTNSRVNGVATSEDHVYIAVGPASGSAGGLRVAPLVCPGTTPVSLQAFTARVDGATIRVRWRLAEASELPDFVLQARSGQRTWIVPHVAIGQREFGATDASPHLAGVSAVTYALFASPPGEAAVLLYQETVELPPATSSTRLLAPYPNPFNPSTVIPFVLGTPDHVDLSIYDTGGRRVVQLLNAFRPAGPGAHAWSGTDASGQPVPSGLYVARLESGGRILSRKLVLIK